VRVCFVSSYPPNHARLSEYAHNLTFALAQRPSIDKIYVIADQAIGGGKNPAENRKVVVQRVWKPDNPSIFNIARKLIELKPDIVHFNVIFRSFGKNNLANITGLSLIPLSRILGFKVLVSIHNIADTANLKKFDIKPSLLNKTGLFVATRLVCSAQTVVVLVRSYTTILKKRYHHSGAIYIPHGVATGTTPKVDPEQKVILVFGHMGPHKGLPLLLEAFKQLQEEGVNVKLLVAGTDHPNYPNYLDKYKKQNLSNVEFVGYVAEEALEDLFKIADVVVMPYLAVSGTSGVFHLACGFGTPIVSSDLPEIHEILSEGASAVLVPPGNLLALKKGVLKVLFEPQIAEEIVSKNLKFSQSRSWNTIASAYEQAYLKLTQTKKSKM
jgi:glycosyltransferase involved in cell wall biosynthesis